MASYNYIVGIDPGAVGGISVINISKNEVFVYPLPVVKEKKRVTRKGRSYITTKTSYDFHNIKKIISLSKKVLVVIENVHPHVGEGSVSSFGFGKGVGFLIGVTIGLGHELVMVSPQSWKKTYPELITKKIEEIRDEQKQLKKDNKNEKDVGKKKENKKDIEKLGRKIKTLGKDQSRFLAGKLCPKSALKFKLKNSDGLAESLLIALYAKTKYL